MNPQIYVAFSIALVMIFFVYFAFKIGDEHWILRFLLIILAIHLGLLIPKTFVDFNFDCHPVVNVSTVTDVGGGVTTIENTYTEYCTTKDVSTPSIFYNGYMWFLKIFWIYLGLWLLINSVRKYILPYFKGRK